MDKIDNNKKIDSKEEKTNKGYVVAFISLLFLTIVFLLAGVLTSSYFIKANDHDELTLEEQGNVIRSRIESHLNSSLGSYHVENIYHLSFSGNALTLGYTTNHDTFNCYISNIVFDKSVVSMDQCLDYCLSNLSLTSLTVRSKFYNLSSESFVEIEKPNQVNKLFFEGYAYNAEIGINYISDSGETYTIRAYRLINPQNDGYSYVSYIDKIYEVQFEAEDCFFHNPLSSCVIASSFL